MPVLATALNCNKKNRTITKAKLQPKQDLKRKSRVDLLAHRQKVGNVLIATWYKQCFFMESQ